MAICVYTNTISGQNNIAGRKIDPQAEITAQAVLLAAAQAATQAAITAQVATATVAANVATLVADGASPTQAHVTTLNTNWGTLLTAIGALNTAINAADTAADAVSLTAALASVGADVSVLFNPATVINENKLDLALRAIRAQIDSTGDLAVG